MTETNGLPKGWVECALNETAVPGGTINPRTRGKGSFQYVDIDALDNSRQLISSPKTIENGQAPSRARMLLRNSDVLFSLVRPYLKNIAIVPSELDGQVASTAYCVLHPNEGVESKFLFYQLVQESFIQSVPTYGNSPPSARDNEFLAMSVRVAPTNEQRRIVQKIEELFSKLDAGVAALERVKANLKRYRAAVLKAAVEGKLTAGWRAKHPDTEPASKLLECILKERRRKWEEAQLAKYAASGREPPKGWREKYKEPAGPKTSGLIELAPSWCWATVEQLLHGIEAGKSFECLTRQAAADEWGVIKVSAMTWGRFLGEENKAIPRDKSIDRETEIRPGDLLLSRSNTVELVGATVLVESCRTKLLLSDKSMRLLAVDAVNGRWLHKAFSSRVARRQLSAMATGTSDSMRNVSQEKVFSVRLPLPPLAEQDQIVAEVERRLSIVDELEAQVEADLKRAGRLRQSILKRAFAGRLVPQDPTDEPAAKLLERIRLTKQGDKPAMAPRAGRRKRSHN
jgi:type I restriction enzyme S subunit